MKARRENERGNIIPRTCYVIVAVAFIFLHFSGETKNKSEIENYYCIFFFRFYR